MMTKRTKFSFFAVIIVVFTAGVVFEYTFLTYLWPNRHRTYVWFYALRNHKGPGEPCKTDQVINRQGYSMGYSYDKKAALWVSYILTEGSVNVDIDRYNSFFSDTNIPEKHQATLEQFTNTGFDKGHQAPSASIDFSREANRETFALSNVTMQNQKLNGQAWGKLEYLEREWTETRGKLYVVTGPMYTDKPKLINGIPLPSKYYKVIYSYEANKAIGFIFPNREVQNADLWRYAMSVQEVEKRTGYTFFTKFSEAKQKKLKKNKNLEWWQEK